MSRAGNRVVDKNGTEMPTQRLSTGELLFYADKLPALGSKAYKVVQAPIKATGALKPGSVF